MKTFVSSAMVVGLLVASSSSVFAGAEFRTSPQHMHSVSPAAAHLLLSQGVPDAGRDREADQGGQGKCMIDAGRWSVLPFG
jgi:hypothetical protein